MTTDTLLLYTAASLALAATPGPTMLLALSNGIAGGMRRASWGIVGASLGSSALIALVGVGLGSVLAASPMLFHAIRICGIAYLVWLGVKLWRSDAPDLQSELLFREDLTPVCSRRLFHQVLGHKPLSKVTPDDLRYFTLLHSDTCTQNWESWLGFAGASSVLEEAKSIFFDSCMMSYEAANAGLGFAVANRAYIESDIRAERLVAPFAIHHPNTAGWYFVCPDKMLAARKVALFKHWVMTEAAMMQSQLDLEISGSTATAFGSHLLKSASD